ncbi:response regulator [Falsiroseomonas sp. HW251]|uniref:response regulator n=1 Tax=Falsiroseomonas sp. HW251 TaxID=3390998 RepID=UPI003D322A64
MNDTGAARPMHGDPAFLAGGGELAALVRAKDWASTPLGPPETWPRSLKTAVRIMLTSRQPIWIGWGEELTYLYNDAYKTIIGGKHPWALGRPTAEVWREIWGEIGPMLATAMRGDEGTYVEEQLLIMERNGYPEETYYTFSYSPVPKDEGGAGGIICANTDDTQRVIGERQLTSLRDLAAGTADARSWRQVCERGAAVLATNPRDLPFAMIYMAEPDGRSLSLVGAAGIEPGHAAAPASAPLDGLWPWPFAEVLRHPEMRVVPDLAARFAGGPPTGSAWNRPPVSAAMLPISVAGATGRAGVLVVGLNPFRLFDEGYRQFLGLVAGQITAAIANADAYEAERRRAEALAEVDRAKTAFFSNVSHEFRTPRTLMLGALEELLARPESPPGDRALAEMAHRNSLRLLRLVNALLDFSRIEAGRAQANYEPTNLARLTAELASSFRSACGHAGLRLDVACEPLPEPVWVDRDMWEKIVLNLLSNAFKFTFEGGIAVRLAATPGGGAELRVSDTGTGIAAADLPRVFERFHRVEGQRSRSHEGSGIGLAVVQELVHLHGGTIGATSEPGRGTTFAVTLPFGTAHLPAERVGGPRALSCTADRAAAYVEEALRWLPNEVHAEKAEPALRHRGQAQAVGTAPATEQETILLAEDNADMRDYLSRLLSAKGWAVEAVANGGAALAAARRRRPGLVLADVMMPELGGLELAAALRREPGFAEVPVILLSARAGEEARIEGLGTGADDYLVKPFAARELLARVASHLELARLRRGAAAQVQRSEARLQAAVDLVGLSPYSWDPVTGALEWDDRLRAIWGLPPDAPVNVDVFLAGIHPDDRTMVEAAIAACTDPAGNGVYHLDYRVVGIGDGVERWVSTHGRTFFEEGRPVSFVGAALEVTERKRAEAALRESEARFREFAEHSASVLWVADLEGARIEYLSRAFEAVWGRLRGTMPQGLELWTESIHGDDRAQVLAAMDRVRRGEAAVARYRILRPCGDVRRIRDTLFPMRDEQGRIRKLGGIAQDVTAHGGTRVCLVGAERASRQRLSLLLGRAGYEVQPFDAARAFLDAAPALLPGCVVLDFTAGWAPLVVGELKARRIGLPVVALGESRGDVGTAVRAMKAGAVDWLEVPYADDAMLAAVASALAGSVEAAAGDHAAEHARTRIAALSGREREVLQGLLAGGTNKTIAREIGLSPRTVEIHRAHVMESLGARTLADLVLLAAAAGLRPSI